MSGQPPSNGSASERNLLPMFPTEHLTHNTLEDDSIMNLNNFLARNPHHGELVWEIEDVGKPGTAEWVIKAKS